MQKLFHFFSFIIYSALFVFAGTFFSDVAFAQRYQEEPSIVLQSDPRAGRADVAVHDLRLEQVFYGSGDELQGLFQITNIGEQSINNLKYAVELVGNFTPQNIPQTIYDYGDISDSITLTKNETGTFDFSYTLPDPLPANSLGIQIKLYEGSERMLARTAISFGTNGETYDYLEHIAQVQVDGEPFGLLNAPIAYEGEQMFFAVSLQNGTQAIELTPEVVVYNRLLSGDKITSYDAAKLFINRFDTREQRIALPLFDYKPGIYTALITYKDEAGLTRSGPFEVRYVVSELEPQIESVAVSDTLVEAGEVLEVSVALSDTPIDIRSNNYEETRPTFLEDMQVLLTLYDAAGDIITKESAVLDELGVQGTLSFIPTKDIVGFRVVADLLQGQVLIDRVEQTYSVGEAERKAFLDQENVNVLLVASIFFGVVIIILLVAYFIIRKQKQQQKTGSIFSIVLLATIMGGGFAGMYVSAETFITAFGERSLYIPTNFQINSPRSATVETYAVGEIVPFQIDLWSQNTNASMQDASVRISSMYMPRVIVPESNTDDASATTITDDEVKAWTEWQPVGSTRNYDYTQTNIPWTKTLTMQAPDAPGRYRVDFEIENIVTWTLGKEYSNRYSGYFEVVVVEQAPVEPLPEGIVVEAEVEIVE